LIHTEESGRPLYAEAARRAHEIAIRYRQRSRELEEAGYHGAVARLKLLSLFWARR